MSDDREFLEQLEVDKIHCPREATYARKGTHPDTVGVCAVHQTTVTMEYPISPQLRTPCTVALSLGLGGNRFFRALKMVSSLAD